MGLSFAMEVCKVSSAIMYSSPTTRRRTCFVVDTKISPKSPNEQRRIYAFRARAGDVGGGLRGKRVRDAR